MIFIVENIHQIRIKWMNVLKKSTNKQTKVVTSFSSSLSESACPKRIQRNQSILTSLDEFSHFYLWFENSYYLKPWKVSNDGRQFVMVILLGKLDLSHVKSTNPAYFVVSNEKKSLFKISLEQFYFRFQDQHAAP